jgi:hypothetical protein
MSLSKKLADAQSESSNLKCKVGRILSKLPAKDVQLLNEVMAVSYEDPASVSNVTLSQLMREEGYDVSKSSFDRHRGKICTCYRKVQK